MAFSTLEDVISESGGWDGFMRERELKGPIESEVVKIKDLLASHGIPLEIYEEVKVHLRVVTALTSNLARKIREMETSSLDNSAQSSTQSSK